jgi:predicted DNA-binding transcriptional regulator AlpA
MTDPTGTSPTAGTLREDDALLTIGEVAAMLRVPVATLRYWRHMSIGPNSFRLGRGVRYWHSDVTNWLNKLSGGHDPHVA